MNKTSDGDRAPVHAVVIGLRDQPDHVIEYFASTISGGEYRREHVRRLRLRDRGTCLNCEFEPSVAGSDFCEVCG